MISLLTMLPEKMLMVSSTSPCAVPCPVRLTSPLFVIPPTKVSPNAAAKPIASPAELATIVPLLLIPPAKVLKTSMIAPAAATAGQADRAAVRDPAQERRHRIG